MWTWALGFLVAYAAWRGILAWKLSILDRHAAARGWPASLAALNAYYRLPSGEENAAEAIVSAGAKLNVLEESRIKQKAQLEEPEDDFIDRLEMLTKRREMGEIDDDEYERERQTLDEEWEASDRVERAQFDAWMEDVQNDLEKHKMIAAALASRDEDALNELLGDYEPETNFLSDEIPGDAPPLSEEWRAGIEETLERHKNIVPHVELAAAMGAARYPVDFTTWPNSCTEMMDAWVPLRTGARLLQRDAILHADAGRTEKAVSRLNSLFRLAQTLENEPTMMAQLVWMSITLTGLDGMAFVLGQCALDSAQLENLDNSLRRAENHDMYGVAWAGERCILRQGFDVRDARPERDAVDVWDNEQRVDNDAGTISDSGPEPVSFDYPDRPGAGHWRLVYEIPYKLAGLETLDCLIYMSLVEGGLAISQYSPTMKRDWLRTNKSKLGHSSSWRIFRSTNEMTSPMSFLLATILADTRIANARTALAIERFRLNHGRLPESLCELPGELPIDIFGEDTLRYRRVGNGYLVYSVGINGKDEGGEPGHWSRGSDIVFQVKKAGAPF